MTVDTFGIESADAIIDLALTEDLGERGDVTSQAVIDPQERSQVNIVAREAGRLSGAVLIERVYSALSRYLSTDEVCDVVLNLADGDALQPDSTIATVSGPVRSLLSGERIVLNFLSHLSGIASRTAAFVERTQGTDVAVLDTRKTLPGYRLLQKYAVRCGGGTNHRIGLYDGVLIKDNHLAAHADRSVAQGVVVAREYLDAQSLKLSIEVEVDTIEQLKDVLRQTPDIVLLDNMPPTELQQAVKIRDAQSPSTLLEASGGINLDSIGCVAASGVDRISIGGLTHSAVALDIGYDWPERL